MVKIAKLMCWMRYATVQVVHVPLLVHFRLMMSWLLLTLCYSVCLAQSKFNGTSIRRGKLNSQFIVTARMDFQIFPNFFRSNTVNIQAWAAPLSSALISGRGSGDLELEHIAILVSLIV